MPDTSKLTRTLDYIETHPDEWDQGTWTRCFAGLTVRLEHPGLAEVSDTDCCDNCLMLVAADGTEMRALEISDEAMRILDLPWYGDGLFSDDHGLKDIRVLVAKYVSKVAA